MKFQTNTYIVKAGVAKELEMDLDVLHVFSAAGVLTFNTAQGSSFMLVQGCIVESSNLTGHITTVVSNIDDVIQLTYGSGKMNFMPPTGGLYPGPTGSTIQGGNLFAPTLSAGLNLSVPIAIGAGVRSIQAIGNITNPSGALSLTVQPYYAGTNKIYLGAPAGSYMDVSGGQDFSFGYNAQGLTWRGDQFSIGAQSGFGLYAGAGAARLCLNSQNGGQTVNIFDVSLIGF